MAKTDVGGQAIFEGVMMKNKDLYSIAIRKPNQEILIEKRTYKSFTKKLKFLGLPILRGMVAFVESLVMGMKIISFSAEFFEVEGDEGPSKFEKKMEAKLGKKKMDSMIIGLSLILATLLTIVLFVLLPLGISQIINNFIDNSRLINFIDGILRVAILITYIALISKMKDIQRVFQYHGAEHKSIFCYEKGEDLTVENVKKQPRLHKRCGTNFLFIVVLISVLVMTVFNVQTFAERLLVRLLVLPLVAGISYEIIKLLGKYDNKVANIVAYPGLCLQKITTKEPDDQQIEVAIAALKGALEADEVVSTEGA